MTRRRGPFTVARGFTVVELLIGIVITALVALAISTMLTLVGETTARSRDERAAVMRSHLAQVRLRSYTEPSLAVLQFDKAKGVAIWLHDDNPGEKVNLTELRVLWFDDVTGEIAVERVVFPDTWTPEMKAAADVVLPKDSDFFSVMITQRQAGQTEIATLLETVEGLELTFTGTTLQSSDRVRYAITLGADNGDSVRTYIVVGMPNHAEPSA